MNLLIACGLGALCLLQTVPAVGAEPPDQPQAAVTIAVAEVLQLGPLPLPLPAFHDAADRGVTLQQLLAARSLDVAALRPQAGQDVPLPGAGSTRWQQTGAPQHLAPLAGTPSEVWLAFYLRGDRWQAARLVISAPDGVHVQAWLGGNLVDLKAGESATDQDAADDADAHAPDGRSHQGDLKLPSGTSVIVVRGVVDAERTDTWHLTPHVELVATSGSAPRPAHLQATTSSSRTADIHLILDAPRVQSAVISADGTLAALRLGEHPLGGKKEEWLEIRRIPSGELVTTWRGHDLGGLQWAPTGRRLSFTQTRDKLTDLWLLDLQTGAAERLLRGVADMRGYQWAPDGSFVVHAVRVEAKPDERKVRRIDNPADRQNSWRHRDYLVLTAVPGGVSRRLTAGPSSPGSWSISPDSRRLLFFLGDQDLAGGRPYFSSELWELDLATLAAEHLLSDRWIGGASYGPETGTLLLQGSPSAFDDLGRNLPDGMLPNDNDGQLYLYDRQSGAARPLTRDFTPEVGNAWWSLDDGLIYARCTDTQFQTIWRCDPRHGRWEKIDAGVEYVDQFDLAREGRRALVRGTSVTTPNQVHSVDLRRNRSQLLHDPGRQIWQDVAFGEVQYWQAPLPDGELLDGRIYWPVDYDPDKTYPVIVYYYGGTSPVTVDFGGRYPKNVWTGQGYIVYVPQPSGAIGYGQEFAARHVNDWGRRTAWEVIEATEAFLDAFPAADPERLGCIGASYGGFLTMYLISQTDLFAAAVSHAGISSISSYWGEGLWGYAYGARALAEAFPWSDRDLYIEQSALFHADRINTPLLLVHGDSDTNVPVGESDQLFTALKLLDREVEYVQILGQDHHILDHDQRIVWNDTILAFFAKWLKDQPAWWEDLYPQD